MCKTYKKAMVTIIMVVFALILGFDFGTEKVEATTTYGANLVVNGNGEASGTDFGYPGSTNYAGWTSVSLETGGTTAFVVGNNGIFPEQLPSLDGGNFFDFFPTMEASDTLYQTIDISDILTDVNSGSIVCDLRGFLKKVSAASSATIVLEMLDSSDQVLASYQLTEDSADGSDDWVYKARVKIPVNINTRKFRVALNASISNINYISDYIEFDGIELRLYQEPVINLKGNNINIANNDYIPDITDHTDFGSADITSGSVTRTFVIENNGTAALLLYGASKVAISGANASDFTVTREPSYSVSAGETTAFDITFNPSAVGVRRAIIVIEYGSFQDPYVFYINGTGTENTDTQYITAASVQITAPVLGAVFQNAVAVQEATNHADFTVTDLTWNEPLNTGGKFKAEQVYTTTVTLTSKNGKKFQSEAFTPTVAGSASVGTTTTSGEAVGNTVSFTVTYAATGELTVSSIAVTTQPTKMSYIETTDGVLALNGMQITEKNNDGSTRIVSFTDGTAAEYTSTPANGTELTNVAHNGHPVTITHTVSGKAANTNNLTVGAYVPSVPVTDYDVWVAGIRVTSANMSDVLGAEDEGATVTYTPATGSTPQTLSMNGAAITGAYTEEHITYGTQNYTIYVKGALNIELTGDNTVTGEGPFDSYGIYTTGALTISGTGSLTTSGASGVDISYGIRSLGNITIESGTVTASGGHATYQSRGIGGNGVIISGGTVSATAGNSIYSFGLDGFNIIISGGTVSASGKVGTTGEIELSGGTVTINGIDNAVREIDKLVYSNGIVSASTSFDGSDPGPYNSANKNSYKYLHYEPASSLTGTVTINGEPKYGQTLTATYNPGNSTGILSYQWRIGDNIRGTNSTYTLVEEDIDKTITCQVSSTHHTGSVTSNPGVTIAKADGPEVTGVSAVDCTSSSNNDGKLIGMTTAMEYKKSGAENYIPATSSEITGLTNGTYLVRMQETSTHNAGADSSFTVGEYVTPVTNYDVWVNGIQVTSASMSNITGEGITGRITYNPDMRTLTLNGATIDAGYTSAGNSYGIYTDGLLNLELAGINSVNVNSYSTKNYGVYANGALNVSGNGELNVTALHGDQVNIAIYTNSNLNISGGTITARSGDIEGDGASYGIYAGTSLTISGGTITASCGNATVFYAIETSTTPTFSGYTPLIMAGESEENASRVTTPIESYGFTESYIRIEPSYTITYRPGTNGSGSVSADYKIHAAVIGLRGATFTRTGYTQTGWATSDGGAKLYELEAIYSVDAAIDLYPVWTIIVDPDVATVDTAKTAVYNATYFNMTQASVATEAAISNAIRATAEAAVNNSSVTTTINKINYTGPEAGSPARPNGTNGTYTFTVTVTKGVQSQTTEQKSITIIATPFIGLTDAQAVAAAKMAAAGGTVTVAYGANQTTKTAAVQDYVNNLLTGDAEGVTAVVTPGSGNIYKVELSKGSARDSKDISMTINELEAPTEPPVQPPVYIPTPTPTPQNDSGITVIIPKKDGQENIDITSVTTEYKEDQIIVTIKAEDVKSELEKEDEQSAQIDLIVPEQKDNSDQREISIILKSDVIQKAKDNNKEIVVDVKDTEENVLYSWTFDKEELTNSDKEMKNVNLSLKVDKAPKDAPFVEEQKEDKQDKDTVPLVIDFAHEGLLPSQASVRIYVGNQEGITPGTKVYLYHYNESIGKLETIPYGYQAIVDEDGYITINIIHCSDYVVYTKEADSKQYVSLRNQIKVTPTKTILSTTDEKNSSGTISVKLPITLEWIRSLDEPTSQSAVGGVTVKFTSKDKKTATVDSHGNITAKAPGEAIIETTITLYSKKTKKIVTRVIVI